VAERIALIAGHFMPEIGYQEVQLAKSFRKLGFELRVFTSKKVSISSRSIIKGDYPLGMRKAPDSDYEIHRLPAVLSLYSLIICRNLKGEVEKFNPDYIIIQGVGKMFPFSLFRKGISEHSTIITLLGDNTDMRKTESISAKIKSFIINKLIKKRIYNLAVKHSRRIVLYTPSTKNIVKEIISAKHYTALNEKSVTNTLGLDESNFFFDQKSRDRIRNKLGIEKEDLVLITATRIVKKKNIERNIDLVKGIVTEDQVLHYIICGFMNDNYEVQVRKYIEQINENSRTIFHLIPFQEHTELNGYYCAADFGLWNRAAISIQQAMGTGLMVIIPDRESVNHLVKNNYNGLYYSDNEEDNNLGLVLKNAVQEFGKQQHPGDLAGRGERLKYNLNFLSYNSIALNIIKDL